MADSITDVGVGEPVLTFQPNWVSEPRQSFAITRYLLSYKGTSSSIEEQNAEVPVIVSARWDFDSKEDQFNFLTFISARIGRTERFWFKYPRTLFRLKQALGTGASSIRVYEDNFHLASQGHERIYIELASGDLIVRKVDSATLDTVNEWVEIGITTVIDRDIALEDVVSFGRYLLCRFDDDVFRFSLESDDHMVIEQRVNELVYDYSDLDPNP